MKKFYIIAGWQDNPTKGFYQRLANRINNKGYEVVPVPVNWDTEIFSQLPTFESNSIIFGFSIGAVIAKIVTQNISTKLLIMASPTPLKHFSEGKDELDLVDVIGPNVVNELKNRLTSSSMALKTITIYGDKEGESADLYVPDTEHEINENYIDIVLSLL